MKCLNSTIPVLDLEKTVLYFTHALGFEIVSRSDYDEHRYSQVFLRSTRDFGRSDTEAPVIGLTYHWDQADENGNAYANPPTHAQVLEALHAELKEMGLDLSAFINGSYHFDAEMFEVNTPTS